MEELKELEQTGTVEEYIENFERLRTRLLLENRLFTKTDFLDVFIGGLKSDVKALVKAFKPTTLDDTYYYAFHMESALDSHLKKLKLNPKPIQSHSTFKSNTPVTFKPIPPPNVVSKNTLIDQRRLLG
jgi:hypothetical protein